MGLRTGCTEGYRGKGGVVCVIENSRRTSEVIVFIVLANNISKNPYFATENHSEAFTMNRLFDSR